MKCLVVVAHPLENSLCHYLARECITHLEAAGHDVTVKYLYGEGFSPQLTADERASYYQPTFDTSAVEGDIEQLKQAEKLVLVFPTWWFGFPAILKGWFDRVWAPGHAYEHASDLGAIKARLETLREVTAVTTLGSPWWVDLFILWKPVYRILRFALLGTCAKNCTFTMFSLYKSETVSKERAEKFLSKVRAGL